MAVKLKLWKAHNIFGTNLSFYSTLTNENLKKNGCELMKMNKA